MEALEKKSIVPDFIWLEVRSVTRNTVYRQETLVSFFQFLTCKLTLCLLIKTPAWTREEKSRNMTVTQAFHVWNLGSPKVKQLSGVIMKPP